MPVTILVPRYRRRDRLIQGILDLRPTALWWQRDAAGVLRDISGNEWHATVTGSPTYGVPSPIGRVVTWPGGAVYATTSASIPTPTASMSALGFFRTSDATAANRFILGRGSAAQHSWGLGIGSTHLGRFFASQSNGSSHALQTVAGAVNDGAAALHLVGGTFDGTTLRTFRDQSTNSTTSLTGSWHTASTAPVQIAAYNTTTTWIGDLGPSAYWASRVLAADEYRHLHALASGG